MSTKEMLLMLDLLEQVRSGPSVSLTQNEMGHITSEELQTIQEIALREGGLGLLMSQILRILELPEGHSDLSHRLGDIAATILSWSIEATQPSMDERWSLGQQVRIRLPGHPLRFLATILDNNRVFVPMLDKEYGLDEVHITEAIAAAKPTPVEVAGFQRQLDSQLKSLLNNT